MAPPHRGRPRVPHPSLGGAHGVATRQTGAQHCLFFPCSLNFSAFLPRVTTASLVAEPRGVLLVPSLSCPLLLPFLQLWPNALPPFQGFGWGFAHLGSCFMRSKFFTIGFHWLLPCPGFLCVGPPLSSSGGPQLLGGSHPCVTVSSTGPQAHHMQRVGQPLPARPRAGSPGDLLRLEGESRQRPPHSEQDLSFRSACYVRRRASPPPLGRARIAVPRLSLLDPQRGELPALHTPGAGSLLLHTPAADGRRLLRSVG
ncbi:hypothetical protein NDU88_006680 [Pleurodeles waltl]|uniref:Uncharacterized protein n=1 Tax=Pleurodeles waltl TaxID=8319 RepID=A0AAV7RQ64_PLEWA|nr:hypothetical protein NDU88_006680 [Pleurodeles waltl]